jgi:prepilin-type N-terminal cleavage/methylation domain-containing protein
MKSDHRSEKGFTLSEVMIVSALIAIMSGVSVSLVGSWLPSARADAGMRQVVFQFVRAREQALSERKNIQVQAVGNDTLQVSRLELAGPPTVLRIVPLEYNVQFTLVSGLPDTPDAFGNATAVDFGGAAAVMFTSDGSLIDQAGVPVNGTVFWAYCPPAVGAQAVTVWRDGACASVERHALGAVGRSCHAKHATHDEHDKHAEHGRPGDAFPGQVLAGQTVIRRFRRQPCWAWRRSSGRMSMIGTPPATQCSRRRRPKRLRACSARDTRILTWNKIRNVTGASGRRHLPDSPQQMGSG